MYFFSGDNSVKASELPHKKYYSLGVYFISLLFLIMTFYDFLGIYITIMILYNL